LRIRSWCSMDSATNEAAVVDNQAARARQLLQEIERVMHAIQADLDAAEAKMGRNREQVSRQGERSAAKSC
jgi:hypothetical protein